MELNEDVLKPKCNKLLLDRNSGRMFSLVKIKKQHLKCNHAWIHINNHPNIANDKISRQRRGIFSGIYSFLFGQTESQDVKQVEKSIAILMQNCGIWKPIPRQVILPTSI